MKAPLLLLSAAITAGAALGGYWYGQAKASASAEARTLVRIQQAVAEAKAGSAKESAASTRVPMPRGISGDNLADIFSSPGPLDRFQGIFAFVQGLPAARIEEEILKAREAMQAGNFDADRMFAMHLLMTRYGLEEPQKAMAWLGGQDMMTRGFGTVTVLASMASKDPQAAAKFFSDPENPILKVPRMGSFAALGLAREWSRTDPAGALAWAKTLPEESRAGAYTGVVGGMMTEDPKAAIRTAQELPPGEDRERLMGNLSESWANRDPEAALKWAGTLEGEEKSEATRKALNGWASRDPKAASAYVATLPPEQRDAAVGTVAGRWANQNPAEAATWLSGQAEGDGKKDAMGSVMNSWTAMEPEKASAWLRDQPEGVSKDQGIVSLANSQMKSDPEAAMTWASTISNPATRSLQMKTNMRQWARRDAGAASAWAQSAPGLTPEDRAELLPAK